MSLRDTVEPRVLAHEILNGAPFTYLDDDTEIGERRSRAVPLRRGLPVEPRELGRLDPDAIERVRGRGDPGRARRRRAPRRAAVAGRPVGRSRSGGPGSTSSSPSAGGDGRRASCGRPSSAGRRSSCCSPGAHRARPSGAARRLAPRPGRRRPPRCCAAISSPGARHRGRARRGHRALGGRRDDRRRPPRGGGVRVPRPLLDRTWRRAVVRPPAAGPHPRLHPGALRREIEPVTIRDFMRFLLRWQHVAAGTRREGRVGLVEVIEQLQGFELAAGAWERRSSPLGSRATGPSGSTISACRARWPGAGCPSVRPRRGRPAADRHDAVAGHADHARRPRGPALAAPGGPRRPLAARAGPGPHGGRARRPPDARRPVPLGPHHGHRPPADRGRGGPVGRRRPGAGHRGRLRRRPVAARPRGPSPAQRPHRPRLRRARGTVGGRGRAAGRCCRPLQPTEDLDELAEAVAEQLLARWGVVFRDADGPRERSPFRGGRSSGRCAGSRPGDRPGRAVRHRLHRRAVRASRGGRGPPRQSESSSGPGRPSRCPPPTR